MSDLRGHKFEHLWINVGSAKISESNSVTLLGVHIDSSLKFDKHVTEDCENAGSKLSALSRLAKVLPFQKLRILMKSIFCLAIFVLSVNLDVHTPGY